MTDENDAISADPELRAIVTALRQAVWSKETASPSCQASWSRHNPAFGQCAVTALLVQNAYGGEILRTVVEGFGSHYYNRLPDGRDIDLTRGQFPPGTVVPEGQPASREYLLKSPRAVEARTEERYQLAVEQLRTMLRLLRVGF